MWKNYAWNPATCSCGNGKYLASIMDGSAMMCDEVNTLKKILIKRKQHVKRKISIFYLDFFINYYGIIDNC